MEVSPSVIWKFKHSKGLTKNANLKINENNETIYQIFLYFTSNYFQGLGRLIYMTNFI